MKRYRPWLCLTTCFLLCSCAIHGNELLLDARSETAETALPAETLETEITATLRRFPMEETPSSFLADDFFDDLENFEFRPFEPSFSPEPMSKTDAMFYAACSRAFGIRFEGTENRRLLEVVESWLGKPYRFGGCSEAGIDCSCLVKSIFEEVYNISLERTSRDICDDNLTPVSKESLQEGDILCFKTRSQRISHVGIFLKDDKFVHASRSKGVTISSLKSPYFAKRLRRCGRVAGVAAFSIAQVRLHDMRIIP